MTRDDVLSRLYRMLEEDFQVPTESLREEAHVSADLHLDSLALVDLMLLVQKDFGFKANTEEFRNSRTLGKLAEFILSKAPR